MEQGLDPQVYFDKLKAKKQKTFDEFLLNFYDVIERELDKAMITKQDLK